MDSYIVGLDPLPGLEDDPVVTVVEHASGAVLLRVASSEVPRVRRSFGGTTHVYDSESKARQVWRLFAED